MNSICFQVYKNFLEIFFKKNERISYFVRKDVFHSGCPETEVWILKQNITNILLLKCRN